LPLEGEPYAEEVDYEALRREIGLVPPLSDVIIEERRRGNS
jgi:hypothetical protein